MRRLWIAALVVAGIVVCASHADAANHYLKDGCTNNGNGNAAGCAASGGAAGAWNSVDNANTGWAASCAAGDILYIQARDDAAESIASNNNGDARWHGGLTVPCSGTSGSPILITNNPTETGRIANGPVGCTTTTCDNATITTAEHSYIRIGSTDALYGTSGRLVIRGGVFAHGTSTASRAPGIVIQGNEITQGWEDPGDGNWSAIRLENLDGAYVGRNYIHDIVMTSGGTNGSSCTGIKLYTAIDSIIEYNTIQRAGNTANCGPNGSFPSQAGGIDDKADSVRNTHRFNYIEDINVGIRIEQQEAQFSGSTGTVAYGNVIVRTGSVTDGADHGAIVTEAGVIFDYAVTSNTISGFGLAVVLKGAISAGGFTFRNNIIHGVSGGNPANRNYFDDGSTFALAGFNTNTNFNAFDSNADYQVDGTSTTIAAWRTASSRDANSHEENPTCGGFTSGSDNAFHIASGTCFTGSSSGGIQGAYGASGSTGCTGHLCGAAGAPAPTVSSVSPNSGTTAGGTTVVITGTDFVAGATATFGGTDCPVGGGGTSTQISCTTPAHSAGAVNVVVTNPDAQAGTLTNGFTYTSPGSQPTIMRPKWRRED